MTSTQNKSAFREFFNPRKWLQKQQQKSVLIYDAALRQLLFDPVGFVRDQKSMHISQLQPTQEVVGLIATQSKVVPNRSRRASRVSKHKKSKVKATDNFPSTDTMPTSTKIFTVTETKEKPRSPEMMNKAKTLTNRPSMKKSSTDSHHQSSSSSSAATAITTTTTSSGPNRAVTTVSSGPTRAVTTTTINSHQGHHHHTSSSSLAAFTVNLTSTSSSTATAVTSSTASSHSSSNPVTQTTATTSTTGENGKKSEATTTSGHSVLRINTNNLNDKQPTTSSSTNYKQLVKTGTFDNFATHPSEAEDYISRLNAWFTRCFSGHLASSPDSNTSTINDNTNSVSAQTVDGVDDVSFLVMMRSVTSLGQGEIVRLLHLLDHRHCGYIAFHPWLLLMLFLLAIHSRQLSKFFKVYGFAVYQMLIGQEVVLTASLLRGMASSTPSIQLQGQVNLPNSPSHSHSKITESTVSLTLDQLRWFCALCGIREEELRLALIREGILEGKSTKGPLVLDSLIEASITLRDDKDKDKDMKEKDKDKDKDDEEKETDEKKTILTDETFVRLCVDLFADYDACCLNQATILTNTPEADKCCSTCSCVIL